MAEPGAPEHDADWFRSSTTTNRTGSQWSGSRLFLSLLDLDLRGIQVSDDSSEAESESSSVEISFMTTRELCVWLRQMGLAEVARRLAAEARHDCNVLQWDLLSR